MSDVPAFPSKKRVYRAGYPTDAFDPVEGMTLRDYFAAKALQSYLNGPDRDDFTGYEWAKASYNIADAMLLARNEKVV